MHNARQTTRLTIPGALVGAICALTGMTAGANGSGGVLPGSAQPFGELHLCQLAGGGGGAIYACREYLADGRSFVALFKGGTVPKAVYESGEAGASGADTQALRSLPVRNRRFDLERPEGVPSPSVYHGTGVCRDEAGTELPCSVFEYGGARQPEIVRYMVFYDPIGGGVQKVDALPAGRNEHALEAELAFQLGRSLANSPCCREQARAHLAHALALFPRDAAYASAFHEFRQSTAVAIPGTDCGPGVGAVLGSSR